MKKVIGGLSERHGFVNLQYVHTYSLVTLGLARLSSRGFRLGRCEVGPTQCGNSLADALVPGPTPCHTPASLLVVPNKHPPPTRGLIAMPNQMQTGGCFGWLVAKGGGVCNHSAEAHVGLCT